MYSTVNFNRMDSITKLTLLVLMFMQPLNACRLWAICTRSDITFPSLSGSEAEEVQSQLTTFYYQSENMLDGWALLSYNNSEQDSISPLYRSESPATNDSALYWATVQSLLESESGRIGLGHLRVATSGSNSIPNPHPWMFYKNNLSYSLIHNGTVSKVILYDLLTDNGSDLSWLEAYPPQTFGGGDWKSTGWANVVDSELILLYVMKEIESYGDMVIGFQNAVINIIDAGTTASQLNIIFSDGETLFVFGGNNGLHFTESNEYYAAMTQPPIDNSDQWVGIGHAEMIVINSDGISSYPNLAHNDDDSNNDIQYPSYFTMSPAYPNPFNGSVYFVLDGITEEPVDISIYSISGRKIEQFSFPRLDDQQNKIGWLPKMNVPSGTYFIQASTSYIKQTQKILFIK